MITAEHGDGAFALHAANAGGMSQEIAGFGTLAPASALERSFARGLTLFLVYSALYGLTLIDAVASLPIAMNVPFAALNGVFIAMMFIIGHDCCHGALMPAPRWNLWLGRMAFIPIAHSVSLWRLAHNKLHHKYTNLKGVDPVWAPMSPAAYRAASMPRRWLERIYRGPLGPLIYYYGSVWLSWMLIPVAAQARAQWKQHLPDTVFVMIGFGGVIAGIMYLGHWLAPQRPLWLVLLLGWAIPFAVWNYLAAISFYLNHTHPNIPWFSDERARRSYGGHVEGSAHVRMPVDLLPLYSGAMIHPAHHANPATPVHGLAAQQAVLKKRQGAETTEYTFSLREYGRILRTCKLFDYDRMCWTDFSGNPTTARLIPDPD